MTLIVGFKCADGFVIAADSQETVGPYRVSRQKIEPKRCGRFDIAAAGSGHGDLIDAFVERLHDSVTHANANSLEELKKLIHDELLGFQKHEACLYSKRDREMRFIIAARMRDQNKCMAWKTRASRLTDLEDFALVGFVEVLYETVAKRMFNQNMTVEHAELACVQVLTEAEETCNYVRGPMSLVIVRATEMRMESSPRAKEMADRLRDYEGAINALFLACAENTPHAMFEDTLARFVDEARKLHRFEGIMVSKAVAYAVLELPKEDA